MLDNSDFADTDIPFEVPVPDKQHLPVSFFTATWSNDVFSYVCNGDHLEEWMIPTFESLHKV